MAHIAQFEHLKLHIEDIKSAINNFADENCIGRGGFGKVYKGKIDHYSKGQQTMVAIKRLSPEFGQGDPEFWKEIMLLSIYKHENIVSLLGYCDDLGEKILVYEYASKKSLDKYLDNDDLTWNRRLNICIGAARGLAYLHTPDETQLRILHRDIKSANILLDENWNAKISDFGLAKFAPANKHFTYLISHAVGTFGYCDPLYVESGLLTKESDVYSFGVVLFEVLCGRLCIGDGKDKQRPLIGLVRECYEEKNISDIIYGNLRDEINLDSLKVFTDIAYQCIQHERKERPLMTTIVEALEIALEHQGPEADDHRHTAGILTVKVLKTGAVDSDSYFIFKLATYGGSNSSSYIDFKNSSVKSSTVKRIMNTKRNEEFTLYVMDSFEEILQISINKVVSTIKHQSVGVASLALSDLTSEVPHISNLKIYDGSYDIIGNLMVEALYKPLTDDQILTNIEEANSVQKAPVDTHARGGLFVVIIHEASIYEVKDYANPSVLLEFRGNTKKTVCMMSTIHPMWNEEFKFRLEEPPKMREYLYLEVFNNSWSGQLRNKESLGRVDITLADVVSEKWTVNRYEGWPSAATKDNGGPASYGIEVELQWRAYD